MRARQDINGLVSPGLDERRLGGSVYSGYFRYFFMPSTTSEKGCDKAERRGRIGTRNIVGDDKETQVQHDYGEQFYEREKRGKGNSHPEAMLT